MDATPTSAPRDPELFRHLLASQPARERRSPSAAVALLLHAALAGALLWGTAAEGDDEPADREAPAITLIIPEPMPELPARIDAPAVAEPDVVSPQTPLGFRTLPPVDFVPPQIPTRFGAVIVPDDYSGEGVEGGSADGRPVDADDVGAGVRFTPYTVAPELRNRDEAARAIRASYPEMLRNAGIGGTVLLWLLIDEEGRVLRTEVKESSGHAALDDAALRAAPKMRFSPALNMDRKVKVWVQIPVEFHTR